ncbi:hypothetical protein LTR66_008968 [Elasticomyces elasticus]|nr:hypothetical protein LTR66_008968 [Elasticomyces elasticus]KAK5007571.1 hypothetical protein LTR28_005120 [Elasticomyces elasticus]
MALERGASPPLVPARHAAPVLDVSTLLPEDHPDALHLPSRKPELDESIVRSPSFSSKLKRQLSRKSLASTKTQNTKKSADGIAEDRHYDADAKSIKSVQYPRFSARDTRISSLQSENVYKRLSIPPETGFEEYELRLSVGGDDRRRPSSARVPSVTVSDSSQGIWENALRNHQHEKASFMSPSKHEITWRDPFFGPTISQPSTISDSRGRKPGMPPVSWSRFPSSTRAKRCGPAGKADAVITRDFAMGPSMEEAGIAPEESVSKRAKIRKLTGRVSTYYKDLFTASSSEYRQWGAGHRSSISTGGTLEFPELEMVTVIPRHDT